VVQREPSPPPFANLTLDDRQKGGHGLRDALRVQAIAPPGPLPTSVASSSSSASEPKVAYFGGRGGAARVAKPKSPKVKKSK